MSDAEAIHNVLKQELYALADACRQGDASSADAARLHELVCNNPTARRWYVEFVYDSISLRRRGFTGEAAADSPLPSADIDPVLLAAIQGWPQKDSATPSPSNISHPPRPVVTAPRGTPLPGNRPLTNLLHSTLAIVAHPYTLCSLAGLVVVGMLVIVFWPATNHGPGLVATAPNGPAATLARATDAKWHDGIAPTGDALAPGQQLKLESGSAEITFNYQAQVILEGPAEFTIVDAGACRLSDGRLTAHVPKPARGFKVHTPDGTVTDLGTEFGVIVKVPSAVSYQPSAKLIADSRQPTAASTEVHVFRGQVALTDADQLSQAPTDPQSQIPKRKSQILSAGQAAVVTANEVKPLPAADPFRFALDKLNGQPRTVLLAEDFEALDRGPIDASKAHWVVRGAIRKHQGVGVFDPVERLAALGGPVLDTSGGKLPVGNRAVSLAFTGLPPNAPPLIGHEIDGRELAHRCEVLIEFDIMPESKGLMSSLAIASAVGPGAEIALWKDADPALPRVEWTPLQWYRVRLLLDVADGKLRDIRAQRSQWRGKEGWVRDLTFKPPVPKVDWTTPPRYIVFGFPVVGSGGGGIQWLDNIRIEVISN
ncbi:MAG: FecR family protein [Planctomycetia bacterium]|nr:FecR family protein [Planctomycetia bacterium]